MSSIGGIGGGGGGIDRVMALRAQILERNQALQRANTAASAPAGMAETKPASFASTMEEALKSVRLVPRRIGSAA